VAVGGFLPCFATACSFAVATAVRFVAVAAALVAVRKMSGL
jgi:hypothetical protein